MTPVITALAKLIAAIGTAIMAFKDWRKKSAEYEASKQKKDES